jgi:hypothetical protein
MAAAGTAVTQRGSIMVTQHGSIMEFSMARGLPMRTSARIDATSD